MIKALEGQWVAGPLRILKFQALVIVAAALLMVALYQFTQRTRLGKALRSVSEDKEASALMGIDVDRMISMTFMVGGAAAGAAGVLYAIMFKQVHFFMGFIPGIKAFTAAVLGGIGNIPGAMLGGVFRPCGIGRPEPVPGRPGNRGPLPVEGRHCLLHAGAGPHFPPDRHSRGNGFLSKRRDDAGKDIRMNPALTQRFPGIRLGLIGGACLVLLSLIGMVEAFNQREIISDVISYGAEPAAVHCDVHRLFGGRQRPKAGSWAKYQREHPGRTNHGRHAGLAGAVGPDDQHAAGVYQCLPGPFSNPDLPAGTPLGRNRTAAVRRCPDRALAGLLRILPDRTRRVLMTGHLQRRHRRLAPGLDHADPLRMGAAGGSQRPALPRQRPLGFRRSGLFIVAAV